jgi:cytochrome b involved in lipid metabolism
MHRKKALRIILSLRAGQVRTSSGTQKAASPERHIGSILSEGIRVRFGTDPDALQVDAYGWSSPLLYSQDGRIEAALVRFAIATPLAVSPGDSVKVNVKTREGCMRRTYSVMRTAPHWRAGVACSAGAVTSIEVCVRRQGIVSSFLCDQNSGFPVQIAVAPAPYFRIQENVSSANETVFVAQGAAAGLFTAWLEQHQQDIEGRYTLIVGARSASHLVQADQLSLLAGSNRQATLARIQIVLCLSDSAATDPATLKASGINIFRDRVTNYLRRDITAYRGCPIYVCGSAVFGVDVARCLTDNERRERQRQPKQREGNGRLRPVCTSHLPNLKLLVAAGTVACVAESIATSRIITRVESAQHNSPTDMWMAVHDRVYDLTSVVSFHPGGEKLLTYRAGRQADEVFTLIHGESHSVLAMLHELDIGQLAPAAADEITFIWEWRLDRIVEIQNDLTNNSRFEQVPTGSSDQLSSAPPVDAIRGAFDIFVGAWIGFVSEHALSTPAETSLLIEALNSVRGCLDEYQARVYHQSFHEVHCCAIALRVIFEALLATVSKIHAGLDDLKRHLFHLLDNDFVASLHPVRNATRQFTLSLMDIPSMLKN